MSFWRIHPLDITGIVEGIDLEIGRLTQARALLAGNGSGKRRGRPVGAGAGDGRKVAKRAGNGMSAAGRKKISEAMKARWAKRKAVGAKRAA
jgi:hypothetical protein